jgi:hypothetical protein
LSTSFGSSITSAPRSRSAAALFSSRRAQATSTGAPSNRRASASTSRRLSISTFSG